MQPTEGNSVVPQSTSRYRDKTEVPRSKAPPHRSSSDESSVSGGTLLHTAPRRARAGTAPAVSHGSAEAPVDRPAATSALAPSSLGADGSAAAPSVRKKGKSRFRSVTVEASAPATPASAAASGAAATSALSIAATISEHGEGAGGGAEKKLVSAAPVPRSRFRKSAANEADGYDDAGGAQLDSPTAVARSTEASASTSPPDTATASNTRFRRASSKEVRSSLPSAEATTTAAPATLSAGSGSAAATPAAAAAATAPSASRFRNVSTDDGSADPVRRSGSSDALSEAAAGAGAGTRPTIRTSASCPDLPHGDEGAECAAGSMSATASSSIGGPAPSSASAPRARTETVTGAPSRFRKKAHASAESTKLAKTIVGSVRALTSTGTGGDDEATLEVSSFIYRYILRESCSQFDSLPLTSLTILHVGREDPRAVRHATAAARGRRESAQQHGACCVVPLRAAAAACSAVLHLHPPCSYARARALYLSLSRARSPSFSHRAPFTMSLRSPLVARRASDTSTGGGRS
jgi:hypothetical protein